MAFVLTDSQEVRVKVGAVSAAGNPAPVELVVLSSSDESVLVVTQEDDTTFLLTSTGKLGTAQVTVTADADIGEGTKELVGVEMVQVVAGEAVMLGLGFETPTEIQLEEEAVEPTDPVVG